MGVALNYLDSLCVIDAGPILMAENPPLLDLQKHLLDTHVDAI